MLRKWNCNKIFLATEDKSLVSPFKEFFGEICVTIDKDFIDYAPDKEVLPSATYINRENDYFLRGKEYLTEIALLSKCNSLVSVNCSGLTSALIMAESFENVYVFNLGRYGVVNMKDFEND